MFYWLLLLKTVQKESFLDKRKNLQLTQDKEEHLDTLVDVETKRKWFWIGLMEMLPACSGLLLTELIPFALIKYDYLIAGVTVSLLVAAFLKNKAPHPPIQLQEKHSPLTLSQH